MSVYIICDHRLIRSPPFTAAQDGDATSLESRWSCKPALGDTGSVCRITYGLGIQYQLTGLNIGMYGVPIDLVYSIIMVLLA